MRSDYIPSKIEALTVMRHKMRREIDFIDGYFEDLPDDQKLEFIEIEWRAIYALENLMDEIERGLNKK